MAWNFRSRPCWPSHLPSHLDDVDFAPPGLSPGSPRVCRAGDAVEHAFTARHFTPSELHRASRSFDDLPADDLRVDVQELFERLRHNFFNRSANLGRNQLVRLRAELRLRPTDSTHDSPSRMSSPVVSTFAFFAFRGDVLVDDGVIAARRPVGVPPSRWNVVEASTLVVAVVPLLDFDAHAILGEEHRRCRLVFVLLMYRRSPSHRRRTRNRLPCLSRSVRRIRTPLFRTKARASASRGCQ